MYHCLEDENLSSVSDADREILTRRSTDNAGILVNLVSGIIFLPSGWKFSVCIETLVLRLFIPVFFFVVVALKVLLLMLCSS